MEQGRARLEVQSPDRLGDVERRVVERVDAPPGSVRDVDAMPRRRQREPHGEARHRRGVQRGERVGIEDVEGGSRERRTFRVRSCDVDALIRRIDRQSEAECGRERHLRERRQVTVVGNDQHRSGFVRRRQIEMVPSGIHGDIEPGPVEGAGLRRDDRERARVDDRERPPSDVEAAGGGVKRETDPSHSEAREHRARIQIEDVKRDLVTAMGRVRRIQSPRARISEHEVGAEGCRDARNQAGRRIHDRNTSRAVRRDGLAVRHVDLPGRGIRSQAEGRPQHRPLRPDRRGARGPGYRDGEREHEGDTDGDREAAHVCGTLPERVRQREWEGSPNR